MKKSLISMILLFLLFSIMIAPTSYTYATTPPFVPTVYVNKQKLNCDAFIAVTGVAMVSFRDIFTPFNMNVHWNQATQTVTATTKDGSKTIVLTNAAQTVYINRKPLKVAQAPVIDGDILYVNLRVISESLEANVQFVKPSLNHGQYDVVAPSIYITTKQ
ncbi:copper amine oxidase N-terminal domain-containing protein [Paenibacillus campi]|uniref:copper amine oxidase N-terminal domain-containing protein n=1 Tax=Paenibacillus campi TaxID=3106031 RepID=UPI002AFFF931|nr:copper amine oxidase N-terminal domain-containing protein [Paenibacillus sp. SGZ-1014]